MTASKSSYKDYGSLETAKKYKKTQSGAVTQVDPDQLKQCLQSVNTDGYVIIPDLLSQKVIGEVRRAVAPLLAHTGRNFFEGELTQRLYSVIAKTYACNATVEHPLVLALLDSIFSPDYLLSQLQVINILAGEKQQPLHVDDGFYPIPRPRPPLGAATVWAMDDFTGENGSTVVIPGSHSTGEGSPSAEELERQISCQMKAGSVVVFLGTLWHGGGANQSQGSRLAVTAQYCEGFCRSQENFSLSVPPERVAQCSENIKRLIGY
jgi:ectoine hydroxylase-related dioxygenase (phytanoyl-CoA dioxygenase family)